MCNITIQKRANGLRVYYINKTQVGAYIPAFKNHGGGYCISDKIKFRTYKEFKNYILREA